MTDFDGIAYISHTAESASIDYNNGTITQARMTITVSATDVYTIDMYLSADGGLNWETVVNGAIHLFNNTGTDLRWKITASGGFKITKIVIDKYH